MALTDYIHQVLDYCLSTVKLVQNRQIGWRTVNRKNGQPGREQQPIFKKLKLQILFSRFVEWVDTTKAMRLWIHEKSIKEGGFPAAASLRPAIDADWWQAKRKEQPLPRLGSSRSWTFTTSTWTISSPPTSPNTRRLKSSSCGNTSLVEGRFSSRTTRPKR